MMTSMQHLPISLWSHDFLQSNFSPYPCEMSILVSPIIHYSPLNVRRSLDGWLSSPSHDRTFHDLPFFSHKLVGPLTPNPCKPNKNIHPPPTNPPPPPHSLLSLFPIKMNIVLCNSNLLESSNMSLIPFYQNPQHLSIIFKIDSIPSLRNKINNDSIKAWKSTWYLKFIVL